MHTYVYACSVYICAYVCAIYYYGLPPKDIKPELFLDQG